MQIEADVTGVPAQQLLQALMLFRRTGWHHRSIEGYKPSEVKVLLCIHKYTEQLVPPVMKVSEISKYMHVTAPTITQLIKGLEANGLIERNIDPTDRRAVGITLTEKGKMVTQKATTTFHTALNGLIAYLGEDQSKQLIELLTKAANYFNEYNLTDQPSDLHTDSYCRSSQSQPSHSSGEDNA